MVLVMLTKRCVQTIWDAQQANHSNALMVIVLKMVNNAQLIPVLKINHTNVSMVFVLPQTPSAHPSSKHH